MDPLHHKQETLILTSPVTGRAADLDQTPDTYFASGLMGAGAVLFPREGRLLAPCDAVVNFVFPKKYALGLGTSGGLEVVLQAGILTATPLVVNRAPRQVHPLTLGELQAGSALLEVAL